MTNLPVTGTHEMRPHEKNTQQTIGLETTGHGTSPHEMRPQVTSARETSPHETTHGEHAGVASAFYQAPSIKRD